MDGGVSGLRGQVERPGCCSAKPIFERLVREWDDYHIAPESFVAEDSIVVVFGSYMGVYKRNGKSLVAPFVHRWEVVDGKITNFQQYTDTASIQAVLT
jgi:ketosteroid isomerase-like protein